jgi:hypothetical protein
VSELLAVARGVSDHRRRRSHRRRSTHPPRARSPTGPLRGRCLTSPIPR